jgi:oligogalacturonide lyase
MKDHLTGVEVVKLTAGPGHSTHLYFTEDGFWDEGRQLILARHWSGAWNFFSCELGSGEFRQLTAFPEGTQVRLHGAVCHRRERLYFWRGDRLCALDLRSLAQTELYRCPEGFLPGSPGVDADGLTVWTTISEDLRGRVSGGGLAYAYLGYHEWFQARPRSRIVSVSADGGKAEVRHEEQAWLGHVNPSPQWPGWLTFCHEGPWHEVQRMWVFDAASGQARPLRPRDGVWGVGHEFWCADGVTVGYHARRIGDDARHLLGFRRFDDAPVFEAEIAAPTQHAHANSPARVVLDGVRSRGDRILLVEQRAEGWSEPRVLCAHDTSRHHHFSHAHPRFSPDGRWVVFTSDRTGCAEVYLAPVPQDLSALPLDKDLPVRRFYWM